MSREHLKMHREDLFCSKMSSRTLPQKRQLCWLPLAAGDSFWVPCEAFLWFGGP